MPADHSPLPRVLIVDDNELNLELAAFLLQADGWQVTGGCDGYFSKPIDATRFASRVRAYLNA